MLKHLYTLALIASISILFSCQKEITGEITGTPGGGTGTVNGTLKARIGGTQWVANNLATASRMQGLINITGKSNDGKILTITLTDSGIHRYTLDENAMHAAGYTDSTTGNVAAFTTNQGSLPGEGGGELTITAIDTVKKTLTGHFSFKVFRMLDSMQINITEGSFTNLVYATTLQSTNTTDTFRVKIDGTLWNPPTILSAAFNGQLAINGTDLTGSKTVGLLIPSNIATGTYTFDFFGGTYIGTYNADPTHSKAAMSGTLTIIEHNLTTRRIRGNFNFHAEELIGPAFSDLTEGYFSVKY